MNQEATKDIQEGNEESLRLLEQLRDEVFDGNVQELALAMGRPIEEIEDWFSGDEEIDEDAEMKIHGLAEERLGEN